jgi:hypothetical protein
VAPGKGRTGMSEQGERRNDQVPCMDCGTTDVSKFDGWALGDPKPLCKECCLKRVKKMSRQNRKSLDENGEGKK